MLYSFLKDKPKLAEVSVNLPFGIGSATWKTDPTQRRAAWALYVELVTRIAVQPLEGDTGLLREALASLHSLFDTTREILKESGPDVGATSESVGGIAIAVLNLGIRPFLSKWHPLLASWVAGRPPQVGVKEHEEKWPEAPKMRAELRSLKEELEKYANALAVIAAVLP